MSDAADAIARALEATLDYVCPCGAFKYSSLSQQCNLCGCGRFFWVPITDAHRVALKLGGREAVRVMVERELYEKGTHPRQMSRG